MKRFDYSEASVDNLIKANIKLSNTIDLLKRDKKSLSYKLAKINNYINEQLEDTKNCLEFSKKSSDSDMFKRYKAEYKFLINIKDIIKNIELEKEGEYND